MVTPRRKAMRVLCLLSASALALTAACSTGATGHQSGPLRRANETPVVSASELAKSAREQAAAEKQPLRVLRARPAGAGAPLAWRTLATSHGDRRLLLEVRLSPCATLLGILVQA
jgi:hypothetical protein